ncbi:hypothetical protein K9L97_00010 [Candidatus Woesearchaeota archaeon]|nr:hypothetical protein [Candidatus Woesearchaeota archaeon]
MVTKKKNKKVKSSVSSKEGAKTCPSEAMAILGLVLNILILPGLGSLINNRIREGIWQIVLVIGGLIIGIGLTLTLVGAIIGIPILVGAPLAGWIWGIFTGVNLVQEATK